LAGYSGVVDRGHGCDFRGGKVFREILRIFTPET
jgi:hypothetical protein